MLLTNSAVVRKESTWKTLSIRPCTLLIPAARIPTPSVVAVVGLERICLSVGLGQGDPCILVAWPEFRAIGRHGCSMGV